MAKRAKTDFEKHWAFQAVFPLLIFFTIITIIIVIFSILSKEFLTAFNLLQALKYLANTAIVSLGLTFVVAVGKSDISFHYVSCFAGMTMSYFIGMFMGGKGIPPIPAILLGLFGGLIFGIINGIAIGKFKLPDMITTIAVGSLAWGMAYLYNGGNYIYQNFLTSGIIQFSDGKLFGWLPFPVLYLFSFYIIGYIILHCTTFGRRFYATGHNPVAASFSGIKVEHYIILAYMICSLMASFSNMLMTAAQGNGNVKGGLVLLMPAWAAVFVGISIFKKPTVYGTFLGAFLIAIMQNGFTLMHTPYYVMDLIIGITLIFAILVSRIQIKSGKVSAFKLSGKEFQLQSTSQRGIQK